MTTVVRIAKTSNGKNIYSWRSVGGYIDHLQDIGYECIQTDDGVLGIGDWICIPPDGKHKVVIVREAYVNEWTSGETIATQCRMSDRLWNEIYGRA